MCAQPNSIDSNNTIYQYDVLGNLMYMKDSMDKATSYTYDNLGRNLSVKVSDVSGGQEITTSTTYDLNNNILSQTDGNGNITTSTYDELNRVKTVTNALEQTTTKTYDANGNLVSEQNYLGNLTKNVYDGINRLVEVRDAYDNIIQQLEYNNANAQINAYDAMHNRTQFLYDKNMRQTGTIDGEGNTSTVAYDVRGNVISKTDGGGNTTTYQYNGDNKLINVTDALGNNTYYTYDYAGNLISQTDGNGKATTYQYNVANQMIAKVDPNGRGNSSKTEKYSYYANGLMKTKTDRNGIVTIYNYDINGRLLSEDAGGQIQTYTYDANGNMLTMTDSTGTTIRTYDGLNRNTSKTVPYIGKSTYEYDLPAEKAGEYTERTTDPKGNVTEKTYDQVSRLSKVTIDGKTTAYQYYLNGNRYSVIYPNGTKETYEYNHNNQVTKLVNKKEDGKVISSFQYTYDASGNQITKIEEKGTTTYSYDNLNRLSTVTEPDGKETSYTYDGAGNRKSEQVKKGQEYVMTVYTYDDQNRLSKTLSSSGTEIKYVYDNNGNLINKSTSAVKPMKSDGLSPEDLPSFDIIIRKEYEYGTGTPELTYYSYDKYNRLVQTKSKDTTAEYSYNAQGYRVEKSVNNKITRYFYEADKVVLETDESNNQKAFQAYGSNLLYRTTTEDELGAQSYYYLYNAHGDVTELINATGVIAISYDYDAFGNVIKEEGEANNSILYAGYQYDKESGLYYLNARYYDSVTARFITEDTYRGQANDPLSLNLYTYCHNEPIIYTDPSGHWKKDVHYTKTYKWVLSEMNTYIDEQSKNIVVYKTDKKGNIKEDKKGNPIVDVTATKNKRNDWVNDQKIKAKDYAKAVAAGDKYVDQDKNILHQPKSTDSILFHGNFQQGKSADNEFVKNRISTADDILNIKSYSTKGATKFVEKYITKQVDDFAPSNKKHTMTNTSIPVDYFNNSKEEAAMFIFGMGMHTVQDTEAHFKKHNSTYSDNPSYDDWKTVDGKVVGIKGSERISNTEKLTRDYMSDFLGDNGDKLFVLPK